MTVPTEPTLAQSTSIMPEIKIADDTLDLEEWKTD